MTAIDLSAVITFHHEGALALPAFESFRQLVAEAKEAGIAVQSLAILDRPDDLTLQIARTKGSWLDSVEVVDFGDLALSRNAAISASDGNLISFVDGDDLWGSKWLSAAYALASKNPDAVFHPEWLLYFTERDFDRANTTTIPAQGTQSFYAHQHASNDPLVDPRSLFFGNLWTANVMTSRDLHIRYPYRAFDRQRGRGIEDWSWNIETLWAGVEHLIVPDTVHLIRMKDIGSLGVQNSIEGMLTHLPDDAVWGSLPKGIRNNHPAAAAGGSLNSAAPADRDRR